MEILKFLTYNGRTYLERESLVSLLLTISQSENISQSDILVKLSREILLLSPQNSTEITEED